MSVFIFFFPKHLNPPLSSPPIFLMIVSIGSRACSWLQVSFRRKLFAFPSSPSIPVSHHPSLSLPLPHHFSQMLQEFPPDPASLSHSQLRLSLWSLKMTEPSLLISMWYPRIHRLLAVFIFFPSSILPSSRSLWIPQNGPCVQKCHSLEADASFTH